MENDVVYQVVRDSDGMVVVETFSLSRAINDVNDLHSFGTDTYSVKARYATMAEVAGR